MRRLFEKAVAGFYAVELVPKGWIVRPGHVLHWPVTMSSEGMEAILPSMKTDMVLDAPNGRRIVIDTKFTSIVTKNWYREESLRSGYLYQMYAYLRSQEDLGIASRSKLDGLCDLRELCLSNAAADRSKYCIEFRKVDHLIGKTLQPERFQACLFLGYRGF